MRAYTTNILPTEAAYYTLIDATLSGGVLTIYPGGSAKVVLDGTNIATLTEYFKINAIVEPVSANYDMSIMFHIRAISVSGKYFDHFCNLATDPGTFYSTELEFINEDYSTLEVTITSTVSCSFTLWELCPEASDAETVIDGVKQSLPRLLSDYNTTEVIVEKPEQIVSIITCDLQQNTDLQGHFLVNFMATERCNVHLRFYDSDVTELFSPNVTTVEAGHNTIEIPHAYLKKLKGYHNFYVTMQCTNGTLSIPIRGILFTVDGGYLATRLADAGMDVSDLAIQQLDSDRGPSEIWAIGVDNEHVLIKKRPYTTKVANQAWDLVYDVGLGLAGAIEFDGNWVRREREARFTIETNAAPMIAIIDTTKTLKVYQSGIQEGVEPITIATNVDQCSLVRGYKSMQFESQDQGMVLAWISNGAVYYKQYAYYNGLYTWLPTELLIDDGHFVHVQVHRLNDFRLGFILQDDQHEDNLWYITDRTYVGQAVPAEIRTPSIYGKSFFSAAEGVKFENLNFNVTQNDTLNVTSPVADFYFIWSHFDHITTFSGNINSLKYDLEVFANGAQIWSNRFEVSIEENYIHLQLDTPIWGTLRVTFASFEDILLYTSDGIPIGCETTQLTYNWTISQQLRGYAVEHNVGKLQGTVTFTHVALRKLRAYADESSTPTLNGTFTYTLQPISKLQHSVSESGIPELSGTFTFEDIQTGDLPI